MVVYQKSYLTNIENYPPDLEYYNHEEADTLIMLQAKNVADMYPNFEIYILSPDTMCFWLLFNFDIQIAIQIRNLSPKLNCL